MMQSQTPRKLLRTLVLIALAALVPVSAGRAANVQIVATISALRAITAASAATIGDIQVADYYGTGSGCPIYYHWNSSDTTADNGGAIINPTGNAGSGRWNLNQPPKSPLHTCVFGIKVDGTTDNSTQLQAALTWAHNLGPNWVHIDGGARGQCIKLGSTLNPYEGELITGDGQGNNTTQGNTCITYSGTSGYVFQLQTPYPGSGTTPFEAPKFRDFSMTLPSNANAGGCIQLNSIAGGFTDDSTSQQPMIHPELSNIMCNMGYVSGEQQIGFQCSKCTEVKVDHSDFYNGGTGVDLEGVENATVGGDCRITNSEGPLVKFISHGTFGNKDRLEDCQLLSLADHGQAVDSLVLSSARSVVISKNFFEAAAPTGGSLGATIHLNGGLTAGIHDNEVTIGPPIPWLRVDGTFNNITATNNGTAGGLTYVPIFNSGSGALYFYNGSGLQQTIAHYGNGFFGDEGWPFNSHPAADTKLPPGVANIFTPSVTGLEYLGYGPSESVTGNVFNFPTTGSSNFLSFRSVIQGPAANGTFDIAVRAYQSNASSGQISCTITDSSTPVGSWVVQNVTGSPKWYTLATAQSASEAGIRCYNSGSAGLAMPEVALVPH